MMMSAQVMSVAASRHSAVATAEGHVWTFGLNNSLGATARAGAGAPTLPMDASGQLGRGGDGTPGRVLGALEVREGRKGGGGLIGLARRGVGLLDSLTAWRRLHARAPPCCRAQGKLVVQVLAGRYHTLAITDQGEVRCHACGEGTRGARSADKRAAAAVSESPPWRPAWSPRAQVFSWGLNDWGQLGRTGQVSDGQQPGRSVCCGPRRALPELCALLLPQSAPRPCMWRRWGGRPGRCLPRSPATP